MLTVDNAAGEAARFIQTIPRYPDAFSGRGIVTIAGGVKYLTCAWVLINILRRHGCDLPIEVWYLGEDEGDPQWLDLVRDLGVECIDAHAMRDRHPHPKLGGWEAKAYAIRHCKFQEVIFLDADNVPVKDPTFLFEIDQYRQTGAIFWPDGFRTPPESLAWKLFGVPYRDEREFESGQFVVDKRRCWPAVCLADWYNQNSSLVYQHIYGDKDTFRFAWHRTGLPFSMPERDAEMVAFALCQHDFAGNWLFQHRIHDKWSLRANRRSPRFLFEQECVEFVQELRRRWSPMQHLMRHLSQDDRDTATRLAGSQMKLIEFGYGHTRLVLESSGYVTKGEGPRDFFWWCENDQVVLAGSDGRVTARLSRFDDVGYEGVTVIPPKMKLRLIPEKTN